jgi:hypothetical protein
MVYLKIIALLITVNMIMGCNALVCRYKVMSHYAWAIEEGYKPEIITYEVSPAWSMGVWDRHVQVRIRKDDEYLWVDDSGESFSLSRDPAFPIGEHYWKFTLPEYVDFLSKYKSYVARNRTLASDEYRALLKDAPRSADMDAPRSVEIAKAVH